MVTKIPYNIQIASHTYKVWFDEREKDGDFRGSALHRYHEILLNPDLHKQQIRVTFLHEVIHVICQTFDLSPSESETHRLAEGIADFLFSNLNINFDFSDIPIRKVEGRTDE